jgi:hypothetical protein
VTELNLSHELQATLGQLALAEIIGPEIEKEHAQLPDEYPEQLSEIELDPGLVIPPLDAPGQFEL